MLNDCNKQFFSSALRSYKKKEKYKSEYIQNSRQDIPSQHVYWGWCLDVSATDISAWAFRPQKMPKADISAITINFGYGMCACINV